LRDNFRFCVDLAGWLIEAGIDPHQVKALERGVEACGLTPGVGPVQASVDASPLPSPRGRGAGGRRAAADG
jgi:hypothetical protein